MRFCSFLPQDSQQLVYFYFSVCTLYLMIHLIWDWRSTHTPPFSLHKLQYKLHQVFSGATFASGLFFLVVALDLNNPCATLRRLFSPLFVLPCVALWFHWPISPPALTSRGEIISPAPARSRPSLLPPRFESRSRQGGDRCPSWSESHVSPEYSSRWYRRQRRDHCAQRYRQ